MTSDKITPLKQACGQSEKTLKKISAEIIENCESIISVCNARKNTFGEPKDAKAKAETVELCVKHMKEISALSEKGLDYVLTIYSSVMKYNELINTCGHSGRHAAITDPRFFNLATEIGNVFEDLFETELQKTLGNIVDALDLDSDSTRINMGSIISNAQKIADYVSKAINYYLKEVWNEEIHTRS